MSATQPRTDHDSAEELELEELRTQLAVLQEENERLRTEYARARRTAYRRTATALAGVGLIAIAVGALLVDVREVLFVIGAIGIFGGILTRYLTPERVLTVNVSDSLYTALDANGEQIRDELGLQPTTVYTQADSGLRAFIPQHQDFDLPDSINGVFQTGGDTSRGIALTPAGEALVTEFEQTQTGAQPATMQTAVTQFGDALVEQFEIADTVTVAESTTENRVVVSIDGTAFGPVTRFDHPVVSTIACGIAQTQDTPVMVDHIDETTVAFTTDLTPPS
jgi:uncharacterized small protein (DUF1192 family)